MNSDRSSVILLDNLRNCFLKLEENQLKPIGNLKMGIVGRCLMINSAIEVDNGCKDHDFNRFIDIETDLPLLTFPIVYKKEIIAIVQIINIRKKIGEKFIKKSFFWEKEFLVHFSRIFGDSLKKIEDKCEEK